MNDLIRLACERAVETYNTGLDAELSARVFTSETFAAELAAIARMRPRLERNYVRVILAGRDDVRPLSDGKHYQLRSRRVPQIGSRRKLPQKTAEK